MSGTTFRWGGQHPVASGSSVETTCGDGRAVAAGPPVRLSGTTGYDPAADHVDGVAEAVRGVSPARPTVRAGRFDPATRVERDRDAPRDVAA